MVMEIQHVGEAMLNETVRPALLTTGLFFHKVMHRKNGCTLSPRKYKTQMEPEQSAPSAFPMHPHFFWAGPTVHFYIQRSHYYYLGNVLHPPGYDKSIPPWTPYAFYWLGEQAPSLSFPHSIQDIPKSNILMFMSLKWHYDWIFPLKSD